MKNRKVDGPSRVFAEMLKASLYICSKIIADLMNAIIREGKVPVDWSDTIIVSFFKGKRDGLDRNNYRGLKLTDRALKVIEKWLQTSYMKQLTLMKGSLDSALVKAHHM